LRLFLAVELPLETREALGRLQAELRRVTAGWRWVRPEGIHLTLRFLGEVPDAEQGRTHRAWSDAAARCRPCRFGLRGLGTFPGPGRPRVLWVGVEETPETAGALSETAAEIEAAARSLGFPAEARGFRPHLTLARAAKPRPSPVPEHLRAVELDGGEAREVVLIRSQLLPSGARYTALERFPLGRVEGRE
jgi:RNA 2',3'-cyclic 3'-phosphodiesterase